MAMTKILALAVLSFCTSALGQGPLFECNADREPDWQAAQQLWDDVVAANPDQLCWNTPNQCAIYRASSNALVIFCPVRPSPDSNCVRTAEVDFGYQLVRNQCEPVNGGGFAPEIISGDGQQVFSLAVYNDPDFAPPPARAARRSRRSAMSIAGFTMTSMTLEEVERLKQQASQAGRDVASSNVVDGVITNHNRRQAEGDNEWRTLALNRAIEKPGDQIVITGRIPSGSSYMIQQSDSQTISISSTVEVGASFFDIFSASVSLTVGADFTTTTTVGLTIAVDCPSGQDGVIYFRPRYDNYNGAWFPSNTPFDFWVPTVAQGSQFASGNYVVECLT